MKKVGRNVYGSGDTIVTKTSHFFQGLTLGAKGGGGACTRYFTVCVMQNGPGLKIMDLLSLQTSFCTTEKAHDTTSHKSECRECRGTNNCPLLAL